MRRTIFLTCIVLSFVLFAYFGANAQERGTGTDTRLSGEVIPPTYDKPEVDSKYKNYDFLGMYGWKKWFDEKRFEYPSNGTYHNDDRDNVIYSFCDSDGCSSIMILPFKSKFLFHEGNII